MNTRVFWSDISGFSASEQLFVEKYFNENFPETFTGKTAKLRFPADRLRTIIAWLLIKYVSHKAYRLNKLELTKTKYGKPCLKDKDFYFNITHSADLVACVTNPDKEVGIDIEEIKPIDPGTVKFALNNHEWENYKTAGQPAVYFFERWTIKESWLKCLGTGLKDNPASFDLPENPHNKNTFTFCYDGSTFHFHTNLKLLTSYSSSICIKDDGGPPVIVSLIQKERLLEFIDQQRIHV